MKKRRIIMNDSDVDKMLIEYFRNLSAPESTTRVIENALKDLKDK